MRWKRCAIVLVAASASLVAATATATTTITDAIGRALEQHSELRQAELSLQLAQLELDATLAVFTLPSLSFSIQPPDVTVGGLSGELRATLGGSLSLPMMSSAEVSGNLNLVWNVDEASWSASGWELSYSQRIDLSQASSVDKQVESARQAVADAEAALQSARHSVVLETISSYSELLSDAAAIAQAEESLDRAERELGTVEELVEEGLKGSTSLSQARLDVLDAQIKLDTLRTAYERALVAFARETLGTPEPLELEPFDVRLDALRADADLLLVWSDAVDAAVDASSSVLSAQRAVEDAEDDLTAELREVLPNFSLEAGYTSDGWVLGGAIEFDFFEPDRGDRIEIARVNLILAEEKLDAARSDALNRILNQQASLASALDDLDRLALEEEKWGLEEQVMTAKHDAGTISEDDWKEFVEEKAAFVLEAAERETALLVAHLGYCDILGLELNWEEWLQ